jgi:IS30 family transposase
MSNQLKMATIQTILSLRAQHWSFRRIAETLGVHRETVARYVRLAESKPSKAPAGKLPNNKHRSDAPASQPLPTDADPCQE